MRFIELLREGNHVSDVYLCKSRQVALTKNGKEYGSVVLQDRTGVIDGKIWDLSSPGVHNFEAMDYVFVEGDVTVFQGSNQLNIKRIRQADLGEYIASDYLPVSSKDIEVMYKELLQFVASIKNEKMRQLAASFFIDDADFQKRFKFHSAAKSVHHGFVGGLLEHTLSVVKLCDYYASHYPVINRDLLICAAMFHDIGKLEELSSFPENDYTDDGQLLGHIVMGTELVGERIRQIPDFPKKTAAELRHCILAHHGELEYGSPKKPALIEALALNFADNTDAKLETMTELLNSAGDNNGWLGYNRLMESNVRKTIGLK